MPSLVVLDGLADLLDLRAHRVAEGGPDLSEALFTREEDVGGGEPGLDAGTGDEVPVEQALVGADPFEPLEEDAAVREARERVGVRLVPGLSREDAPVIGYGVLDLRDDDSEHLRIDVEARLFKRLVVGIEDFVGAHGWLLWPSLVSDRASRSGGDCLVGAIQMPA